MYSITEAANKSGMKQGEISSLIHMKMIKPASYTAHGRMARAIMSDRNVQELRLIKRLRQAKVKRSFIRDIINLLRESKQEWYEEDSWIVICNGKDWFITTNGPLEASRVLSRDMTISVIAVKF